MPCLVRWADPAAHEASVIRPYCPSLADKVEAAGPYRLNDVDATEQELRQFKEGIYARRPDLRPKRPWWKRLMEMICSIISTQTSPDDVEERWLAFRQEKRAMRRGDQQL